MIFSRALIFDHLLKAYNPALCNIKEILQHNFIQDHQMHVNSGLYFRHIKSTHYQELFFVNAILGGKSEMTLHRSGFVQYIKHINKPLTHLFKLPYYYEVEDAEIEWFIDSLCEWTFENITFENITQIIIAETDSWIPPFMADKFCKHYNCSLLVMKKPHTIIRLEEMEANVEPERLGNYSDGHKVVKLLLQNKIKSINNYLKKHNLPKDYYFKNPLLKSKDFYHKWRKFIGKGFLKFQNGTIFSDNDKLLLLDESVNPDSMTNRSYFIEVHANNKNITNLGARSLSAIME